MAGEGIEIAIQRHGIHSTMHYALTTIHHNVRTHGVSLLNNGAQIGSSAQRIRCLRDGHHAGTLVQKRIQLLGHQATPIVKGQNTNLSTTSLGHSLPRHDIGVVLHLADNNVIALVQEPFAPGIGYGIDRSGSTRSKDNLLARCGTNECAHALTSLLVELGSLRRELMHTTMYIGILLAVQTIHRLDNALGLLCRCTTIEIDERLAVYRALQNGEISAYALYIHYNLSSFEVNSSARIPPISPACSTISLTNPSICIRRACSRLKPR